MITTLRQTIRLDHHVRESIMRGVTSEMSLQATARLRRFRLLREG
jgi:hypothetical protein